MRAHAKSNSIPLLGEFSLYSRRNYDFQIKIAKQVELVHCGQVEDG
jgi:hypothetical protein